MVRIVNRDRQRITENGCRLVERYCVLRVVLVRFFQIHSNCMIAGYHDDGLASIAARGSHRKRPDTTTIPPRAVRSVGGAVAQATGRRSKQNKNSICVYPCPSVAKLILHRLCEGLSTRYGVRAKLTHMPGRDAELLAALCVDAQQRLSRAGTVLHDDAGSLLAAAGLRLQLMESDYPAAAGRLREVSGIVGRALESFRRPSHGLNSSPIRGGGVEGGAGGAGG